MPEENQTNENQIPQEEKKQPENEFGGEKVIDEANYQIRAPRTGGPTAIGKGGDPLFRRINASKEQLLELMEETQIVQDWVQRETCNNVALSCLNNENLKEGYYQIKDGFGEYGKISLMGFKTPSGVEIPRLKIYDTEGEVIQVLTGPMAVEEISKRIIAYKNLQYEAVPLDGNESVESVIIEDYAGNEIND